MKKWLIGIFVVTALGFLWGGKVFEATNKSTLRSTPHKQVQRDVKKDSIASDKTTSNLTDKQAVNPGVNNSVASATSQTGSPLKAQKNEDTNWSKQFPNAKILEQKELPIKNEKGLTKRLTVLKTGLATPYVRVEQVFKTDATTGEPKMIHQGEAVANHLIVGLKEGVSPNRLEAIAHQYSAKIINKTIDGKIVLLELPDHSVDTLEKMISAFSSHQDMVAYAEPDYLVHPTAFSNDPYPNACNLSPIKCEQAWDIETGKSTVLVAVIGTAMDINHEDLAANIWTNPDEIPGNGKDDDNNGCIDDIHGWDFTTVAGDANPNEDPGTESWVGYGHETLCAGILGAVGNNGKGTAGICWTTRMVPIRCSSSTTSNMFNYINGIKYATKLNVRIMSNSWRTYAYWETIPQGLKDSILEANTKGILFVASAGNENINNDVSPPAYPASYDCPNIISVGASDSSDAKASFSNYGNNSVDLFAPGVNLTSTLPGNRYVFSSISGTSASTPVVAGACALLASHYPSMTAAQIKQRLLDSVDKKTAFNGKCVSGGRLNIVKAFTIADTWEPADNSSSSATPLLSPALTVQSQGPHFFYGEGFTKEDGTDWYKMDVVAGKNYFVRFQSSGDLWITIYEGSSLGYRDGDGSESGIPFTYTFTATQNSTYYFEVEGRMPENQEYFVSYGEVQSPPTGFSVVRKSDGIHLSWNDISSDETGFTIERNANDEGWSVVYEALPNSTSWTDTQVTAQDVYTYRVCSHKGVSQSMWAEMTESDEWDPTDNTWNSATSIDSFTGTDSSHGPHSLYGSDQADWFVFNLEAGVNYEFRSSGFGDPLAELYSNPQSIRVASDNNSGGGSMFKLSYQPTQSGRYYLKISRFGSIEGNYTLIYHATPPNAPENARAVLNTTGIQLSWEDKATNEQGFKIERATGSGGWEEIKRVSANSTSWLDDQADLTQYNKYRVCSHIGSVSSGWIEVGCTDPWDALDGSSASATVLEAPEATEKLNGPHSISDSDPTDWFKLQLVAGEVYEFKLETAVPFFIRIYQDPQGAPVQEWSSDSTSDNTFVPNAGGTYFVRVEKKSDPGNYTLKYRIVPDADNDGLGNLEELAHGANPKNPDTDNDGMRDGWEVQCGLNPNSPTMAERDLDPDGDHLTNIKEFELGTRADLKDTDGDGLEDGQEVDTIDYVNFAPLPGVIATNSEHTTPPFSILIDGNKSPESPFLTVVSNGYLMVNLGAPYPVDKINLYVYNKVPNRLYKYVVSGSKDAKTWTPLADRTLNPKNGLDEISLPNSPSYQYIHISARGCTDLNANNHLHLLELEIWGNVIKKGYGTSPTNPESDGDGIPDGMEVAHGFDPAFNDSDHDGILDGDEDSDRDGVPNKEEVLRGTDPFAVNRWYEMVIFGTPGVESETSFFYGLNNRGEAVVSCNSSQRGSSMQLYDGATIQKIAKVQGFDRLQCGLNDQGLSSGYAFNVLDWADCIDREGAAVLYENGVAVNYGKLHPDADVSFFSELTDTGYALGGSYMFDRRWPDDIIEWRYYQLWTDLRSYVWHEGQITELPKATGWNCRASDINARGDVTGCMYGDDLESWGKEHAFIYRNGTMTLLSEPEGWTMSGGDFVNDEGLVAGHLIRETTVPQWHDQYSLFTYDKNGVMKNCGTLGGDWIYVSAMNNQGMIVGNSSVQDDGHGHAFLYRQSDGVMQDIHPFGWSSAAYSINKHGHVVGCAELFTGHGEPFSAAFLYVDGKAYDLKNCIDPNAMPEGYVFRYATTITDSGYIAAYLIKNDRNYPSCNKWACLLKPLDTDGDGVGDADELLVYHTNPNNPHSDNDGINDYDEIFVYKTDPNKTDSTVSGSELGLFHSIPATLGLPKFTPPQNIQPITGNSYTIGAEKFLTPTMAPQTTINTSPHLTPPKTTDTSPYFVPAPSAQPLNQQMGASSTLVLPPALRQENKIESLKSPPLSTVKPKVELYQNVSAPLIEPKK